MKITKYWIVIAIFFISIATAQDITRQFQINMPVDKTLEVGQAPLNDEVRILAVMVEFQTDNDQTTVGDGKFNSIYTQTYNNILDPLPHDTSHFEAHLKFAKNYFERATKGNLTVMYKVLPGIITVSKTMKSYSPTINSNDFSGMAELTKEVWEMTIAQNPDFDFSSYNLFTIFHAGVGRDISLPGSLGNERDLPSIYMGLSLLQKSFGAGFTGIQAGTNFKITNSMILPQTNSREVESYGTKYLFEVTINGLLVANIASHIGLPDLFDTKTGLSAIGRFGLMDGQSIFAYNGVLPPELSAWELLYLDKKYNWNIPVKTINKDTDLTLRTESPLFAGDTFIVKVPINSTEYYLIENKQRDPQKNGITLTINYQGNLYEKRFLKDTTGFLSYNIDSLEGVIVNADNFNWAIPGSGILIWHIDEDIISKNISENKINTDKNKRGVRVIEADGINDIGEQFQTIFGDLLIGEGDQDDLFFASNSSDLYKKNKNKYNSKTRPATLTTSGANSLISFSDFSDTSNIMTFKISFGDSIVKPIARVRIPYIPEELITISKNGSNDYYFMSNSYLYKIDNNGAIIDSTLNFSTSKPLVTTANETDYIIGTMGTTLNVVSYNSGVKSYNSIDTGDSISTNAVLSLTPVEQRRILVGTKSGKLFTYSLATSPVIVSVDSAFSKEGTTEFIVTNDLYTAYVINNISLEHTTFQKGYSVGFRYKDNNHSLIINDRCLGLSLTKTNDGKYLAVALGESNKFYLISDGAVKKEIAVGENEPIRKFILSDLKNDGENYIVYTQGNRIHAVNLAGASADNFPYTAPVQTEFTGLLASADIEGDKKGELIALTSDGRIYAIDGGSAKTLQSFPIDIGKESINNILLFHTENQVALAAMDRLKNFYIWSISPAKGEIYWSGQTANSGNNNFKDAASKTSMIIGNFLPKERVYNYPNPVYSGSTNIRYYVSENSSVTIKIFDLSGDFVAELSDKAAGGTDNETKWDVTNIQSGIYLARIEAKAESGKSESAIIKIAVIK
ncbi:MAG TPA: T9SS type A sorting domain-containing protein [Ignavibacteriaceae bacterium]|nr:T9SS type A sorting domain-containing protein [Ignavibacteriaceae bacterium]